MLSGLIVRGQSPEEKTDAAEGCLYSWCTWQKSGKWDGEKKKKRIVLIAPGKKWMIQLKLELIFHRVLDFWRNKTGMEHSKKHLDEVSSTNELKQLCIGVWVKCVYAVSLKLERGHFAHIDCGAMWLIIHVSQCQRVSWWPTSQQSTLPYWLLTTLDLSHLSPPSYVSLSAILYSSSLHQCQHSLRNVNHQKHNNEKCLMDLVDLFQNLYHLCSLCCLSFCAWLSVKIENLSCFCEIKQKVFGRKTKQSTPFVLFFFYIYLVILLLHLLTFVFIQAWLSIFFLPFVLFAFFNLKLNNSPVKQSCYISSLPL